MMTPYSAHLDALRVHEMIVIKHFLILSTSLDHLYDHTLTS